MQSYADSLGRTWFVDLNYESAERVKAACRVDFFDVVDEKKAAALWAVLQWPKSLIEILWTLNESRAAERGVDRKSFDAGHSGDVWDSAAEAIDEAITAFFPRRLRQLLTASTEARKAAEAEALTEYKRALGSPELRDRLRDEVAATVDGMLSRLRSSPTTSAASGGNSPGSSACIAGAGLSERSSSPPDNEESKNGTEPPESPGPC